jgi:hypothetical protein
MKKIIYNVLTAIAAAFIGLATSCSEDVMDEINRDINHPTAVSSNFIVTQVETSTAFSVSSGDFNTYLAVCVEHEGGADAQMFDTDHRYFVIEDPSSFGNIWTNVYQNLAACKDIVRICSEGGDEPDNAVNRGIGKTLMAYNLAILTDLFGDAPWSEALDFAVYMQPKLDRQEDIYKDVFSLLDEAQSDFASGARSQIAAADVYYGGDVTKWTKAVNALKARYTMRLIGRSADRNGDLNKVLDYVSKSFTSASEELKLDKYDGATMYNPVYVFCRSRNYFGLSKSFMDKLVARKDPRVGQVAVNGSFELITPDDEAYNPIPNGTGNKATYSQAATNWSETAPTQLLSYHELLFLKAEAQARLNQDVSATLRTAVAASYENLAVSLRAAINSTFRNKVVGECTLTAAQGEEHFDQNIKPLLAANALREVMIEKYISFFGASGESTEAFSDYRRMLYLNENFVELANPNNTPTTEYPKGHFPLRLGYGNGDTNNNQNVNEAQGDGYFVYNEPVWWAGGSR